MTDALTIIAPKTVYIPFTEDSVTLDCVITSGTPTEIKWYGNNERIFVSVDPRLSGGNIDNPALTISEIEMGDRGSYVCEATNEFSTVDTNTISLSPIGKLHFILANSTLFYLICLKSNYQNLPLNIEKKYKATLQKKHIYNLNMERGV